MLDRINGYVMRRLGKSRRQLFETVERPALSVLPETDHEFAEWRFARVSLDYHVELDGFFYSVPHKLIREQVDTRVTARMVEIFHRGQRVAVHERRHGGRRYGTDPDHMPSSHRRYAEWTPDREDVDRRAVRGLDRLLFLKLASCDWIRAKHNLLITGQGLQGGSCHRLSPHPPPVPGAGPGAG